MRDSDTLDVRTRRVPPAVPLTGVLLWDWRESYIVFLALVVPGFLWTHVPVLVPLVLVGLLLVGVTLRIRRIAGWWSLLRSGDVAAIDSVDQKSVGRGTMRVSHATEWRVHRGWFTGDVVESSVAYTVGDVHRYLKIRGLPYTSGIVVAHPRQPNALCVSDFPFDLRLRADDRWSATVPTAVWLGAAATVLLYGGLIIGAVISAGQP